MKKLYAAIAAVAVAFSASAADYYLIGGFNNWSLKDAKCLFTDNGDGNYTLDYDGVLTPGFKINDGTWSNDAANFGGNGTLVIDEVFNLTVGGTSGNIQMSSNVPNPHIIFNPEAKTLLITGQTQEISYAYGLHGQIFGDIDWATYTMEEKDGKWVVTGTCVPGDFGIKEMDASTGNQTNWFSASLPEGVPVAAITEDNLGQPQSAKIDGTNWSSNLEGDYTFTFDPKALTLTVTVAAGVSDIEADVNAEAVYYNLQGVRVDNPENGLFIEVRGSKVTKVIL